MHVSKRCVIEKDVRIVVYAEDTPMMEAWRASEDRKAGRDRDRFSRRQLDVLPEEMEETSSLTTDGDIQKRYIGEIKQRFKTRTSTISFQDHEREGLADLEGSSRTFLIERGAE